MSLGDLIKRETAIEILGAQCNKDFGNVCGKNCSCAEFLAMIDAPAEPQWVPCSERLPEEFKKVLCCTDKEEMFLACVYIFDNGYTFDNEERMMWEGDVVAWMPLPEPYKGGDE